MRQYSCRNTVVFLERQYSIPVGILFFYLQLSRCFVLPKQSICCTQCLGEECTSRHW